MEEKKRRRNKYRKRKNRNIKGTWYIEKGRNMRVKVGQVGKRENVKKENHRGRYTVCKRK